jgi:hypothetical protein
VRRRYSQLGDREEEGVIEREGERVEQEEHWMNDSFVILLYTYTCGRYGVYAYHRGMYCVSIPVPWWILYGYGYAYEY